MKRLAVCVACSVLAACGGGGQDEAAGTAQATEEKAAVALAGDQPHALAGGPISSKVDPRLHSKEGPVEVWVSLSEPGLAAAQTARKASTDARMSQAEQRNVVTAVAQRQSDLMGRMASVGAQELARVTVAHNAIAVRVEASQLEALAALSGVAKVRPVQNYQMHLAETVPYIGAAQAQATGKDGSGVVVAVIDSGIDYTHRNLGGAGTDAAYTAAYGSSTDDPRNKTPDGLFPTAKVVGGYDFVGERWDGTGSATDIRDEDADPIDLQGHGTHVADIIAGRSADGTHVGVAPGAKLMAIKACSAIATSCNGIALLKAIDFALDPNGDGSIDDAVDIINMSLGSDYGIELDDLAIASANAVELGVLVVASAGNGGDRPYISGSPAMAKGVLSVAQTQVPSATQIPLVVSAPAAIAGTYYNTATVDWAPITGSVSGPVAYVGQGCPAAGGAPEDAYLANPAGKVVLIDRGACSVSLKVDRAAKAGATAVLIGLVAPGDAVSFSNGGGTVFVPTMVIQQSLSSAIKANVAAPVQVALSTSNALPLVGSMASSSSRGPASNQLIKPEIGAPGASVSAIAGGGTAQEAFGGTSGAAPMVSGAAAILKQAHPDRSPIEIKAMLMNSAETTIYTNQALVPGEIAPISRIGAGEVRVAQALPLGAAAWNPESDSAALSFGFRSVALVDLISREVVVQNFSHRPKTFRISQRFRDAADEANGAVKLQMPGSVSVPAHGRAKFKVYMSIDGRKLPAWGLNGGELGGTGSLLQGNEFDGHVVLTSNAETLSLPWHVLPRKSSAMEALSKSGRVGRSVPILNAGVEPGQAEVFALTGVSPKIPRQDLPAEDEYVIVTDIRAVGVRLVEPGVLQFAINSFGARAHPLRPVGYEIGVDVDADGNPDYYVFNDELSAGTGVSAVFVFDVAAGTFTAYAYNDADLNSSNMIFTVPTLAFGVSDDTPLTFSVNAFDIVSSGQLTDSVGPMTFTPSKPRYVASGLPPEGIRPLRVAQLRTAKGPGDASTSPSQSGFLLLYRNQKPSNEADLITLR